jgi:hypothetical protein
LAPMPELLPGATVVLPVVPGPVRAVALSAAGPLPAVVPPSAGGMDPVTGVAAAVAPVPVLVLVGGVPAASGPEAVGGCHAVEGAVVVVDGGVEPAGPATVEGAVAVQVGPAAGVGIASVVKGVAVVGIGAADVGGTVVSVTAPAPNSHSRELCRSVHG